MDNNDFYTFSEYMKKEDSSLTASMEDYLEMIYRLSINTGFTRMHELSNALNVQPPSATKMVQKLAEQNFLDYEKYGVILLKDSGKVMGKALLTRHNIIENFLKLLGISNENVLEETEKIEHTISNETLKCFERFASFLNQNNEIIEIYNEFVEKQN